MRLANLADVQAWYRRQFTLRAYTTQVATILLIATTILTATH
jgi:hypothetical protein